MTIRAQATVEIVEFAGSGQLAGDEQIRDLLIPKTVLLLGILYKVLDVVTTQDKMALVGHDPTVDHVVSVHVRDARETGDHAGAVRIAQAALHVVGAEQVLGVFLRGNIVVETVGILINAAARLVIENQAAQVIVEAIVDVVGVVRHSELLIWQAPRHIAGANEER